MLYVVFDLWAQKRCQILYHFGGVKYLGVLCSMVGVGCGVRCRKVFVSFYATLVCTAIHAVKCDNVATFLGKKLDERFKDGLGNVFCVWVMGSRVKHCIGFVVIKMYDEAGLVLCVEIIVDVVGFFCYFWGSG